MSIKCMVHECTFYHEERCQADSIQVVSAGDLHVTVPEGTCCLTFKTLK